MAEVLLNDNLIGIASKLVCGKKVNEAMKLAAVMTKILEDRAGNAENDLLRAIMEG
jgi:NifU-like protein involved in Fe-S cluster formation